MGTEKEKKQGAISKIKLKEVTSENKVKCKVTFSVSKAVTLHGVGLYCKPDSGMLAAIHVSTFANKGVKNLTQTPWLQVTGAGEIAEVSFPQPVILTPRLPYSILACIKGGSSCLGEEKIEHFYHVSQKLGKKVFFKFIESGEEDGQIPGIIF